MLGRQDQTQSQAGHNYSAEGYVSFEDLWEADYHPSFGQVLNCKGLSPIRTIAASWLGIE